MDRDLRTYLKVYKNFFTPEFCSDTVEQLEKVSWVKHHYHHPNTGVDETLPTDLDISYDLVTNGQQLQDSLWNAVHSYVLVDYKNIFWFGGWQGYTKVRYNKYAPGTSMRTHCDHIPTIFDGTRRGVPILTILGALNDDYEGGELIFWGDEEVKLKAGDVAIFPSNFLYPHEVKEITSGTRYSYVSWVW